MHWQPKTPYLSVDGIIEVYDEKGAFQGIALIERKNEPKGIAFAGGFVDVGERVEDALVREMLEETSLHVKIKSLLGIYSDPMRDPIFHTVSIVYVCEAIGTPKAGDDAKEVTLFDPKNVQTGDLVFDHAQIFKDYLLYKERS